MQIKMKKYFSLAKDVKEKYINVKNISKKKKNKSQQNS